MTNEEQIILNLKKLKSFHNGSYGADIKRGIEALEQKSGEEIIALLEKTYTDFCECEGGEGWLKIDGKEYSTDAGYAIDGVRIFMEVFKQRFLGLKHTNQKASMKNNDRE